MAIELQFNTKIRLAVQLINDGEVNPIIDFNDTRYHFDTSAWHRGMLKWTPWSIALRTPIGDVTHSYPYAAHNILSDAVFGPSGQSYTAPIAAGSEFPNYPTPPEEGTVTP